MRSETPTPPASPCSRRSPVTSCSPRCTATTPCRPCTACSTWASRPSSSPRPSCRGGAAPRAPPVRQLQRGVLAHAPTRSPCSVSIRGGSDKTHFFHGVGCSYCSNTGFHGRIGVYELLRITPELRRLIVGWATTEELRRLAVAQGMRTMLRRRCSSSKTTSRQSKRS